MATAKKTTKKATKPVEAEVEVPDTDELEEIEGDTVESAGTKKSGQEEVTFGASDLAKHLTETTGTAVNARELRTLIRKMARDGSNRVNREITAGNRSRYNWSGLEDPEVKAIIAAFKGGELEADKQAKLQELKEKKAAKKAAGEPVGKKAKAKATKGKSSKKAAPAVEVEEDEELNLDDDE